MTAQMTDAQRRQQLNRDKQGKYQEKQHSEADTNLLVAQPDDDQAVEEQPVTYSFIADFEEMEEQFNTDFEGVPTRFFNADLRGKAVNAPMRYYGCESLEQLREIAGEVKDKHRLNAYIDHRQIAGRLCNAVSSPADNRITDDQAEELLRDIPGATKVAKVDDEQLMWTYSKNATRAWWVTLSEENDHGETTERMILVSDASTNKMRVTTLHSARDGVRANQHITDTDLRTVAGSKRLERLTGQNILAEQAMAPATGIRHVSSGDYPDDGPEHTTVYAIDPRSGKEFTRLKPEVMDRRRDLNFAHEARAKAASIDALIAAEDAQLAGRNFKAQQKYVKDQRGSIATAFDDKKHPDKTRQQMMEDSKIVASNGGHFSKVEYDNDVDPAEAADFEQAIQEVETKMPPIPGDRRPDLRVRYLGKHRAKGIYSPSHNTVAVDVRTSEAYIHEMAHYYDLTAKGNASLSDEFRSISNAYSSALKEPDPKRRGYLNTPTEQFARGFEMYAHERLGINNRLVKPSNFEGNDYAPYRENPQLKERLFEFFDRTFKQ
jgi:hypothetical protein